MSQFEVFTADDDMPAIRFKEGRKCVFTVEELRLVVIGLQMIEDDLEAEIGHYDDDWYKNTPLGDLYDKLNVVQKLLGDLS